jgi:hypothetical protein
LTGGLLQRKCDCGQHTIGGSACGSCSKRAETDLQRSAIESATGHGNGIPPIVHDVLSSQGQPLNTDSRTFFEPRFGHDFSRVRVHSDAKAEKSARELNALAYTVGHDVVFGAGLHQPETAKGKELLAHELTHVIQQNASSETIPSRKDSSSSSSESEARQAAQAVVAGHSVRVGNSHNHQTLQLSPIGSVNWDPAVIFKAALAVIPTNHAGNSLTESEKQTIAKMPSIGAQGAPGVSGKKDGRLFVVHDTGSPITAKEMADQDKKPRSPQPAQKGPLGVGYSVVPRTGDVVMNRKSMFEEDRPTATAWEKGEDKVSAVTRVTLMHKVWAALDSKQQAAAIDFIMKKFGLTAAEVAKDKQDPAKELDPSNTCVPKDGEPCIHTLAQWAVERACDTKPWTIPASTPADKSNAKAVAAAEAEAKNKENAKSACEALDVVFKLRAARIPFTTNVEVRQIEDGALPSPIYTESQYEGVKNLYLMAALEAGAFPHITTHFWVDRAVKGHTDPRCFNMTKLNTMISARMNYKENDLYGDPPKYGPTWGVHNVWWDKSQKDLCQGPPPA